MKVFFLVQDLIFTFLKYFLMFQNNLTGMDGFFLIQPLDLIFLTDNGLLFSIRIV